MGDGGQHLKRGGEGCGLVLGMVGVLLAVVALLFGDNLYRQMTGREFFERPVALGSVEGEQTQATEPTPESPTPVACQSSLVSEPPQLILMDGEYRATLSGNRPAIDYCFRAQQNDRVRFAATPDQGEAVDLVLELYDATPWLLQVADEGVIFEPEVMVAEVAGGREYLLRVRGFAGSEGSYSLSLSTE